VLSKGNSIVTHQLVFTDEVHLSVLVQIWERDWQVFPSSTGNAYAFSKSCPMALPQLVRGASCSRLVPRHLT